MSRVTITAITLLALTAIVLLTWIGVLSRREERDTIEFVVNRESRTTVDLGELERLASESPEARAFLELRRNAERIKVGMTSFQVARLLGEPDDEADWLEHLPDCKSFFFDADRADSDGLQSKSFVRVLMDREAGVKMVDVYDPVLESCSGNKIESTCTPINIQHHDRLAGPVIRSG